MKIKRQKVKIKEKIILKKMMKRTEKLNCKLQEYFAELCNKYELHKNDLNFDNEKFLGSIGNIDEYNNNI